MQRSSLAELATFERIVIPTPQPTRLNAEVLTIFGRRPKVLFVTPESADFLQAGGLGSVSASLPRALVRQCDPRVLLPGYPAAVGCGKQIEVVAHLPGAGDAMKSRVAMPSSRRGRPARRPA